MKTGIDKTWARLRKWYEDHLPKDICCFEKGASLQQIRKVERHCGVTFPKEVEESYLVCNGLHRCGLSYFGYFNSLKEVVTRWDFYRGVDEEKGGFDWPRSFDADPHPAIKKVYWNRLRIPLTDNQDGNGVFLDLDPTKKGTVGQIIFLRRLEGPLTKLADGLKSWLEQFLKDLKAGKYVCDAEAESLIPEDQW